MPATERAAAIKLLLFDVDGVLTDGKILLHGDGSESKRFDIRDGTGVVWAQRAGITVGFLSARVSAATTQRAAQLGITLVIQRRASKLEGYEDMLQTAGVTDAEVAFMGDDLLDLPVLLRVGLAAAPADAVEDVRQRVHWVSRMKGGEGAARELVEMILRAQDKWDALVASFVHETPASAQAAAGAGPGDAAG